MSCLRKLVLLIHLSYYLSESHYLQTDWELKQFNKLPLVKNYASQDFDTEEDVINDSRNKIKDWMSANSVPGTVFGIGIKGKTVWTEGFGYTDIENDVKTHKDSVWRLASISKPLTAALVGTLIDRKILNLNKSIDSYLSKNLFPKKLFNGKAVKITLRQLLSHMAGLHVSRLPDDFSKLYKADNVSQTIVSLKNSKLLSKPGTEFAYSNYGYQVIGAIIESALKSTFQKEIQNMCSKLQMNSTFAETRAKIIKHRPRYYSNIPPENTDIIDDLFPYEGWWPSGAMVSTVDDLLKFGYAMLSSYKGRNKNFLRKSTVKELWTPETIGKPKDMPMNNNEYAKGWFINHIPQSVDYPYKTLLWHSGGLIGTSTIIMLFPDQDIVGVAFANRGYVLGMDQLILYSANNFKKFI